VLVIAVLALFAVITTRGVDVRSTRQSAVASEWSKS
jgi:hypothetical protein